MNSTLLQNFPPNYPLGSDFKYHSSDRSYTTNPLSTSDYLERKNNVSATGFNQSLSIGAPPNGLDYNASQLQHETACSATGSHLILTPPHSNDESTSATTNPSSSSYTYSSLPKVSRGSVSGPDYYPNASRGYLHSTFNAASMTHFDQQRPMQIQAPLSPPYQPYGQSCNTSFSPFTTMARNGLDFGSYSSSRHGMFDLFNRPRPSAFAPGSFPPSLPSFHSHSLQHISQSRLEGPPFDDTYKIHNLVTSRGQVVNIDILASIPKGFFRVEDKWTCYRRNYFTVSCAFTFKPSTPDGPVFLSRYSSASEQVSGYAVSIAAKTQAANNAESEARGLVQHTPKRDKATESVPTRHPIVATPLQDINSGHALPQASLYPTSSHLSSCLHDTLDVFAPSVAPNPQTNHTFERIQFQKATANNGKRRAQQQYFHVVVKLEVNVGRPDGPDEWVVVASKQSHPMVVRGRSPGHYKDDRRHSQASLDPDPGSGRSGEGGPSAFSAQRLDQNHATGRSDSNIHYRSAHHYGSSFSRANHGMRESDSVSFTSGTSTTLGSSPAKDEHRQLSYASSRTTLSDNSFDRIALSPNLSKRASDMMEFNHTKKSPFEEDRTDCTGSFFTSALEAGYNQPHFDFSATATSQRLCASS